MYNNFVLNLGGVLVIVYLDIILIENFIIDFFLLKITSKVMRISITTRRLIIASVLGSLYTVTLFIPKLELLTSMPFKVLMSFFIICALFKNSAFKVMVKGTVIFILLSVLLSGLCLLLALLKSNYSITTGLNLKENSMKNIVLSLIVLYLLMDRIISYFKERALINNFIYDVEFELNDLRYYIKGFLDTGNELKEPLTNLPCILVEEKYMGKFDEKKCYFIPYSAVGVKGNLKGIKVKEVRIRPQGGAWQIMEAVICPCSEVLSRDNDFNALLSRGII